MNEKFKGVFPALLTPMCRDGSVNESALRELIRMNLACGVNGFYVCGSTAEVFLLTDAERVRIYEIAAQEAGGRAALIAHVGAISTAAASEFGKVARSLGYDAVSAVSPFYYKFSFEQIKKHYFDIAQASGLPMLIYNIPTFSGVTLTVEQVGEFLRDDGFLGVKHTSSDYFALERFKTAFPDRVIYNGFDEMFLSGLSMGADGGIGSTYNFMAPRFLKIRSLFEEGKMNEALQEQQRANEVIAALIKIGVIEGAKEVLCQMGIDAGGCRAPFAALTDEQRRFVREGIMPLIK